MKDLIEEVKASMQSNRQIRYEEGRSSIFDLLQARQKYHKAQQDAVQAKYESLIRQKILEFYYAR